MTGYIITGVNLNKNQARKVFNAHEKGEGTTIRLTKENMKGNHKLPLTQMQVNQLSKSKKGVLLRLSAAQIKYLEKSGGIIPLLALIPAIAAAVGATGGLAGGIASAVNSSKQAAEQARHNRAIEEQLAKSGSGVVANIVGKIPFLGEPIRAVLEKIGLGQGGCVSTGKYIVGKGLYLSPNGEIIGEGLFCHQLIF